MGDRFFVPDVPMMMISDESVRAIAAHAEATYPDECVGLLLGQLEGTTKTVMAVFPVENTWQGQVSLAETDNTASRRDRFYLDPRDYLRADREARRCGLDVVGCYHSHPDDVARPSERDRVGAQAAGGGLVFSFVIQSVRAGVAGDLTSWLLVDAGARFVEEAVQIVGRAEA